MTPWYMNFKGKINKVDNNTYNIYWSYKVIDGNNIITMGLKNYWIAQKKAEANGLLSKTDWYIVRNAETTTAIPSEVTTERDNIRSAMTALETKINNAGDLDAFIALFATSTDESGNRVKSDMDCF